MCSDNDNSKNKIEKLRAVLNEISLNLLKDEKGKTSEIISVSKEMDNLISEYILKKKSDFTLIIQRNIKTHVKLNGSYEIIKVLRF